MENRNMKKKYEYVQPATRDFILPNSQDAERLVLGSLMTDRNALPEVRNILSPDSFYSDFHQKIYQAILNISSRGDRPDSVTVHRELLQENPISDAAKLSEIASYYTFDVYQHAAIVHDLEKRRKFIEIAELLKNESFDESYDIVDIHADTLEKLKSIFVDSSENIHTINKAIDGVRELMKSNHSDSGILTGTPTGFVHFDSKSGGLQKSDLIVIAADTSQGKTSLAITIALNAAIQGTASIAMYSMEMKKEQIAARMMSIKSGVPANKILYSRLTYDQFDMIDRGIATLYGKKIYFDDRSTSNIDTITSSIRSLKYKFGIDGAILDYLQILNVNMKGSNKESQMGEVARRLKNLAKELDIWIIALSQLNRDNVNPNPSLARLRDSGQIAEAADVVMLIYRPEIYGKSYPNPFQNASVKGTAMIDVAKGRNIGLMKFLVGFDSSTTKFYDFEDDYPTAGHDNDNPF
jgi:replicative DNA helicase